MSAPRILVWVVGMSAMLSTTATADDPAPRCRSRHCASYPALSADGTRLATFDPEYVSGAYNDRDIGECDARSARRLRVREVVGGELGNRKAIKSLAGYEPLDCQELEPYGQLELRDGFVVDVEGSTVLIVGPDGVIVTELLGHGADDYAVCQSQRSRTIVSRWTDYHSYACLPETDVRYHIATY